MSVMLTMSSLLRLYNSDSSSDFVLSLHPKRYNINIMGENNFSYLLLLNCNVFRYCQALGSTFYIQVVCVIDEQRHTNLKVGLQVL
jgi:hypothetical protein